jgi:hypothetical protein
MTKFHITLYTKRSHNLQLSGNAISYNCCYFDCLLKLLFTLAIVSFILAYVLFFCLIIDLQSGLQHNMIFLILPYYFSTKPEDDLYVGSKHVA